MCPSCKSCNIKDNQIESVRKTTVWKVVRIWYVEARTSTDAIEKSKNQAHEEVASTKIL